MMRTKLSVETAQRRILGRVEPLPSERVPVAAAAGRVLASIVEARWQLPASDISMMDGYAVRAADLEDARQRDPKWAPFKLAAESAAGHPLTATIPKGAAARISTGAVLPAGTDAVIPQEEVLVDAGQIRVDLEEASHVSPGRFVRKAGSDLRPHMPLLEPGHPLYPGDIALAASAGHVQLDVYRRPRIAIISTGDELVDVGTTPGPGQIISTNGLMLAASCRAAGGEVIRESNVADTDAEHQRVLGQALDAEVVIITGGVSVGDHDLVVPTLTNLGCQFEFHGVTLRPGKPAAFAHRDRTAVFALPGNPGSALVCFELFVRPALRRLQGVAGNVFRPRVTVTLTAAVRGAGSRDHYVRAQLGPGGLSATPLQSQRSGDLRSISGFDALVVVPAGTEQLAAGSTCEALLVDPRWTERAP